VDERVGNEVLVLGSGPNSSHYTRTAETLHQNSQLSVCRKRLVDYHAQEDHPLAEPPRNLLKKHEGRQSAP